VGQNCGSCRLLYCSDQFDFGLCVSVAEKKPPKEIFDGNWVAWLMIDHQIRLGVLEKSGNTAGH